MYPGQFGSDLNWKLSLIQARLLLSRQEHPRHYWRLRASWSLRRVSSFSAFSSSSRARSDLVFGCHALYLARGIEGVGVTSVAGFRWTL
jgi:hypothetical protein